MQYATVCLMLGCENDIEGLDPAHNVIMAWAIKTEV